MTCRRLLAVVGVAVLGILALPTSATAGVDKVGWFTRNPAASAPEGGIEVANAPDGVVSYGAVSVTEEADTITAATLTLTEVGGINAAGAALQVCPAAGSFPAGKATLADGPKADCLLGKVALTKDGTGAWSADVTSLLQGENPAVAIVPADGAGLFSVSFGPPDVAVEADGEGGSGLESSFDASEFGGSDGGDSSTSFDSSSSSSDFSLDSSSSSSSFGSGDSGLGTFSPSTFDAGTSSGVGTGDAVATTGDAAAEAAPTELASPIAPRRQNLAGAPASATSGGSGVQFVFFVLTAAVIGTGAGFARNRFVTSRA